MPAIEAILIGAGERGRKVIGQFALDHPDQLRIVAVAEPDSERRERLAREHGISEVRRFDDFEPLLAEPRLAPLCFNTSMDRQHLPSALMALERGYDLFLEKPMAVTPAECLAIADAAQRAGRGVQICHPLRYAPFYTAVKGALDRGAIGRPVSITMHENVGHWHFAHAYVRGNWGRVESSGPLILTKCCHDMDLAVWLVGKPVRRVASLGSLTHFREENAPEGAPERCTDGCPAEATCLHFAPRVYLTDNTDWPASVISNDPSIEARRRALETGPYGRCVYRSPNTTADHQVVMAEFDDGTTLDFAVRAFTDDCFRTIRILGTEGELSGHLERADITVTRFKQGVAPGASPERVEIGPVAGSHLGGDSAVIGNFLRCHIEGDHESLRRSLDLAIEGHLLAFAAEHSRQTGDLVEMSRFRELATGG